MNAVQAPERLDLSRRVIAVTAMGVGALALIGGWWLDNALLRSLHCDFANMKANNAVASDQQWLRFHARLLLQLAAAGGRHYPAAE